MKKKTLALLGVAAFATVALASCNNKKKGGSGDNDDSGSGSTIAKAVWDPVDAATAKQQYTVSGDINLWLCYSKTYGSTYNGVITSGSTTNPIDNKTYSNGDQLPAWKEFQTQLGATAITQGAAYGKELDDAKNYDNFKSAKDSTSGAYKDKNGDTVDLFYNTTANLNELGDDDELVDLTSYINDGKMPALKKFLDDNGAVKDEITHNGKIFYTPYLDGFQAVERNFMMDTEQVEKLLDNDLPAGTGNLVAGKSADGTSKGLKGEAQAKPFIDANNNYATDNFEISIVNPKTSKAEKKTVKQTTNIIKQQNELLNTTDSSCTGKALINQFKAYAREAYGDIIDNCYDGKISKMFTSVGACYNADDLVALLRIFKANPDVLFASNTVYDEVIPVFPRGQANNRAENILNFAATLYGVQGRGSEYDHLFFGADGKIHDFDTQQASYDMLDKLHDLYTEGLIQANFWSGDKGTYGLDTFFTKKTKDASTYGLLEYDYIATQSAANEKKDGVGTDNSKRESAACGFVFKDSSVKGINAILSPLTYVSTESYNYSQNLDDKTGKTITRYYEENRSVKNTSWAIPKSSDNINAAIALMDFLFTKEGWEIQNFGPSSYWNYGTVLGVENTPIIKQDVLDHFSSCGLDFWNYCRGFLGTTQGVGHYRPTTLDFQATNYYSRDSYTNLVLACDEGVQINSRAVGSASDITWHASMPMACFSKMDKNVSNTYAGVTTFWSQGGKVSTSGTKVGWIMIMVEGKDTDKNVLTSVPGSTLGDYTYQDVKDERDVKNKSYLYSMGNKLNLIAPEAKAA